MKKPTRKKPVALPPFQDGQVWQMGESSLHIGLVGKTLVHYKHYKGQIKRPPVLLSAKGVLEKLLKENDAILLPGAPRVAPPAGRTGSILTPILPSGRRKKASLGKPQPAGAD